MSEEVKSEWQTQKLTEGFLQGVRGAIPGADLQLAVIGKITDLWCSSPSHILDLGCGNGILGKFLLTRFPKASGLFIDFSDPMLAAARQNIGGLANAAIVKADFGSPQWRQVTAQVSFDIVISGFAIHHQPDARKQELYGEIFELLAPGGVFLNLEHVASATEAGEALFDDFFVDHLHKYKSKSDRRTDRRSIADDYYRRPDKKENILARVDDQCDWLRQIGYADVDCFFKVFELALFGGRRAANQSNAGGA